MKFVHPEILWALGAIAIPIIVHLFNFRKFKKVLFSNVEFLREIKQETQSKSKIKHWLILISRILALSAMVFAFAQPYIPAPGSTDKVGANAVSVYIDNSFSMQGENQNGRLLELAKNKAIEIVGSFQPTDKFQLLTSEFEGRHQRLVSKEEMVDLIQEVDIAPVSRKISEVVSRQRDLLNNSKLDKKTAFILTDLQSSITDLSTVENDTSIHFLLVPDLAPDLSNLFIDSVWFASPVRQLNQPEVLNIRIQNSGDENRENIPIQLEVNGQQKSVATANISAGASNEIQLSFSNTEPGYKNCKLVVDDNTITIDDAYYFSYDVASQISVLEIKSKAEGPEAIAAVFKDDPYFLYNVSSDGNIDYGSFAKTNLILLNQLHTISSGLSAELEKFVTSGGSLLIIPESNAELTGYNELCGKLGVAQISAKNSGEEKVNFVNYEHFIYKNAFEKNTGNIDLPIVKSWFGLQVGSKSSAENMMSMQNGLPFIISAMKGSGRIYLSAVSLQMEESNFINHAFFPATLLRIAEFSQPVSQLAYYLGKEQAVALRNLSLTAEGTFKLKNISNGQEIIPEHRTAGGNTEIFIHADLDQAGNYSLNWADQPVASLSFNFDRAESYTKAITPDFAESFFGEKQWGNWAVLNDSVESIAGNTTNLSEGKKYWLTMIICALIFLAIEVLLIKFWR
jgi:hypothetical protein